MCLISSLLFFKEPQQKKGMEGKEKEFKESQKINGDLSIVHWLCWYSCQYTQTDTKTPEKIIQGPSP